MSPAVAENLEHASWSESDTSVATVVGQLAKMQQQHVWQDQQHAAARSLNLIVAPVARGKLRDQIDDKLEKLAERNSWRTIVLRMQEEERIDSEILLTCSPQGAGEMGLYHDRVTLAADRPRLEHADSLVLPLVVADVAAVMWLPSGKFGLIDARLARLVHHLVLDSAQDDARTALRRAAYAHQQVRVYDLVWGRLSWWRARIANAFDDPEVLAKLGEIDAIEIVYAGSAAAALLTIGWVASCVQWRIDELWPARSHWTGRASGADRQRVKLTLDGDQDVAGYGGLERVTFKAGDWRLDFDRGGATDRHRDVFTEALAPLNDFHRGYHETLTVLNEQLETTWHST